MSPRVHSHEGQMTMGKVQGAYVAGSHQLLAAVLCVAAGVQVAGAQQKAPPAKADAKNNETIVQKIPVAARKDARAIQLTGGQKTTAIDAIPVLISPDSPDEHAAKAPKHAESVEPLVKLVQHSPKSIGPGEEAVIELVVTNTGKGPVDKVIVSDLLSAELAFVRSKPNAGQLGDSYIWSLGVLQPAESKTVELTVRAKPGVKQARLSSTASVGFLASVTSTLEVEKPQLSLSLTGPTIGRIGEPANLQITVKNAGTRKVTGILLTDKLPEGLTHPYGPILENEIGELTAGESKTITLTLTPTKEGAWTNKVVILADGVTPISQEAVVQIGQPPLAVAADSPEIRFLNRPCTYRFTVTNKGQSPVNGANVTTQLPPGLSFAHASEGGQFDTALRTVQWTVPAIAPGESKALTITALTTAIGEQSCEAVIRAGDGPIIKARSTTVVKGAPALLVEVFDVADPIAVGKETVYEIHVVNQGETPATNVQISSKIPGELEPVAADGPTAQKLIKDILVFDKIATLAPKSDLTYRIRVIGKSAGDIRFPVAVSADQLSRPIFEEESTNIESAR